MLKEYPHNSELNIVTELQLAFQYTANTKAVTTNKLEKTNITLNVLSLFSGCGGMDLGFEGGFSVSSPSINEILSPHFIDKKINKKFIQLKKTRFKTVFANDILTDARNAWVNHFSKKGINTLSTQVHTTLFVECSEIRIS